MNAAILRTSSSSTDLCGQRPKNMAAQSHICNNQQGCIADECCLQTCLTSPVPCGATAVAKENPGGIVCASLTCQRSECCQDLCKSISCNTGYYMPNENKVCDAGTCSQGECCARTTCAMTSSLRPYSCPAGYQPKMTPADQIYCGGECTLDTCCDQVKCPVSYQCASGYTPKDDMTNQLCPQTQCRNQDCCKLACSGWFTLNACPAGTRSRLSAAMPEIPCSGGVCTASVCCQENTCVNTAFNCAPPNWLQRSDYSTVKCSSGPSCTEADCCVKTCSTWSCSNGYTSKMSPQSISCGSLCGDATCCDRTKCPANYQCSNSALIPKDMLSSQTCVNSICRDTDCCRDQCANFACPDGTMRNGQVGCAGDKCTQQECCVTKPQCPADYPCNTGEVHKRAPAYCEAMPCRHEECCCSACAFCGTAYGSCGVGQRKVDNAACPNGVCSAALCCVASCSNYPCDLSWSRLDATASCPGQTSCSAAYCCIPVD